MQDDLKLFDYKGGVYQWREGEQPNGATPHKARSTVADKRRATATKQRTPRNKGAAHGGHAAD